MWDGLLVLLGLCIVMAAASFLSGMLPLYFSLSSRQLRLISALGTGILVGTALIIIIPEGVETIYTAGTGVHARSVSMLEGRSLALENLAAGWKHDTWRREDDLVNARTGWNAALLPREEQHAAAPLPRQDDNDQPDDTAPDYAPDDTPDSPTTSHSPHAYIGISLIAGFILMYLIDTLPKHLLSRRGPQRTQISLNNLSFHHANPSITSIDHTHTAPPAPTSTSTSTTTGLVIHACADGIALGASSTTTSSLTFIIFLALIVHKAPAAFGLTSVLLKQGLSKRSARAHLIVFALAAPLGAILTFLAAHLLGFSSASVGGTEFATGILLLFSGGTFLYVACHTMMDSSSHGAEGEELAGVNGYRGVAMSDLYEAGAQTSGAVKVAREGRGRLLETLVTVLGMLLPLGLSFGHAH